MRFLVINRFFGGDQTPTGRMARDVAIELCRHGHEVEVIASRTQYAGDQKQAIETHQPYRLKHVTELGGGRIGRWGQFWLQSIPALASRKWNRCLILTDPPFLPFAAWLTACFRTPAQRIYWWTMDLYPEALVAAHRIREGGVFYRALRQMNELGMRQTYGVIALGPSQQERLGTYRAWKSVAQRSTMTSPWDLRPMLPSPGAVDRIRDRLGLMGKKVALYAGNLGEGHLFKPLVEAAKWLQEHGREDWVLVFVVRGSGRSALEGMAAGLSTIQVMDYLPKEETAGLLWLATVHLITMKPGWEGVIVPSKLYGALLTTAPVLFLGPSNSDTAVELGCLRSGLSLSPVASGAEVVRTLDELARPGWLRKSGLRTQGPEKIVDFILR